MIAKIKALRKKSKVEINFEYSKDNLHSDEDFEEQPGKILMKECDTKLRITQENLDETVDVHAVKCVSTNAPLVNSKERDKNITTLTSEIDAKESEIEVAKDVLPE